MSCRYDDTFSAADGLTSNTIDTLPIKTGKVQTCGKRQSRAGSGAFFESSEDMICDDSECKRAISFARYLIISSLSRDQVYHARNSSTAELWQIAPGRKTIQQTSNVSLPHFARYGRSKPGYYPAMQPSLQKVELGTRYPRYFVPKLRCRHSFRERLSQEEWLLPSFGTS